MKARGHIFVSGAVQGVFFRQNTCQQAKQRELKGWVRNLPDGRVEAVFEGEKKEIEKVIKWARKGPVLANVKKVEVFWEKYKGEFSEFEIRY